MAQRARLRPQIDPANGDIGYQLGILTGQIAELFIDLDEMKEEDRRFRVECRNEFTAMHARLGAVESPVQQLVKEDEEQTQATAERVKARSERRRMYENNLVYVVLGYGASQVGNIWSLVHRAAMGHL